MTSSGSKPTSFLYLPGLLPGMKYVRRVLLGTQARRNDPELAFMLNVIDALIAQVNSRIAKARKAEQ